MVTAIHVAGVLERELKAAGLGVHAHPARLTVEAGQGGVEHLDVDGTDVAAHPLLEHVDQETAVLRWSDRPAGDQVPVPLLLGDPLDDGDELDECRVEFVAQEGGPPAARVAASRMARAESAPAEVAP